MKIFVGICLNVFDWFLQITYLKRNQNSTVDDILRSIFKDELTNQYNLDGRSGKMSLLSLDAILKCVQSELLFFKSKDEHN